MTGPRIASVAVLAAALGAATLAACSNDGRTLSPPGAGQTLSIITTSSSSTTTTPPTSLRSIETSAGSVNTGLGTPSQATLRMSVPWADGGEIASRFTCAGDGVSPSITWTGVPADAVELAVLFTDLDSDPAGFVHWLVAGLDPGSTGIAEGRLPEGAAEAQNGFGTTGYRGPCPPESTHTYLVTLYALRDESGIVDGAQGTDDLLTTLETRAISSTAVSGTASPAGGLGSTIAPTAATLVGASSSVPVATTPAGPTTTRPGTITLSRP